MSTNLPTDTDRCIDTDDAKAIAQRWYSPRAQGLVELATCTTPQRPLSDTGLLWVIREVAREIHEAERMAFTTVADLAELDNLHRWAEHEADLRGLR